jgi:hypothetical protein
MRTTLTLDDEVMVGIRNLQKKRPDASFKQIVNEVIKKGLAEEGEIKHVPFKVRTIEGVIPRPGLNFDNVWKLLSEVEGPSYK